jgi:hypothetical protein
MPLVCHLQVIQHSSYYHVTFSVNSSNATPAHHVACNPNSMVCFKLSTEYHTRTKSQGRFVRTQVPMESSGGSRGRWSTQWNKATMGTFK